MTDKRIRRYGLHLRTIGECKEVKKIYEEKIPRVQERYNLISKYPGYIKGQLKETNPDLKDEEIDTMCEDEIKHYQDKLWRLYDQMEAINSKIKEEK